MTFKKSIVQRIKKENDFEIIKIIKNKI
eukprot:SAG11_NODE_38598_length_251_cov_1.414474_1_plen_27_part_10